MRGQPSGSPVASGQRNRAEKWARRFCHWGLCLVLFCLTTDLPSCFGNGLSTPIYISANSTARWDGSCSLAAAANCTEATPCALGQTQKWIWTDDLQCALSFLPGDYSNTSYWLVSGSTRVGTLILTSAGSSSNPISGISLQFGVAEYHAFDLALYDFYASSAAITSYGNDTVNITSSYLGESKSLFLYGAHNVSVLSSYIVAASSPVISLNTTGYASVSIASSLITTSVSLLNLTGTAQVTLLLGQSSFSGPTLTDANAVSSLVIADSLIVSIASSMMATDCYLSYASIMRSTVVGASSSTARLCAGEEAIIDTLIINSITSSYFQFYVPLIGVIDLQASTLSDPEFWVYLTRAGSTSNIVGNSFRRSTGSAPALVVIGANDPTQSVIISGNSFAYSGGSAAPTPDLLLSNFSGLVTFQAGQSVSSIGFDKLRFTGSLTVTSSISGQCPSYSEMELADASANLTLFSITTACVRASIQYGNLTYSPTNPVAGIQDINPNTTSEWSFFDTIVSVWWNNNALSGPPMFGVPYPIVSNVISSSQSQWPCDSGPYCQTLVFINDTTRELYFEAFLAMPSAPTFTPSSASPQPFIMAIILAMLATLAAIVSS